MKKELLMRNKSGLIIALSLICLLLFGHNAFAAFELNTYAKMFVTNAEGNVATSSQAAFGWNEQPWLYIKFYDPSSANPTSMNSITWTWDGTPTDKSFFKFYMGSNNEIWLGFSQSCWENTVRKAGDWTISGLSLLNDRSCGDACSGQLKSFGDTVNFKVNAVPEPVSALLFLTGGGAIAALRRRKA